MMLQELIEGQNLALLYAGAEAGESVDGIAGTETAVRAAPAEGNAVYTNATPYFSNACGFFYYGGADSSGCARTAGLMYEMPGVEWEHAAVSYNSMILYHWSVVTIDGQRYTVDPCFGIPAPEQSRFSHPGLDYIFSLYGIG